MHYNIEGRIGTAKLEKRVFAKAMRLPYSYYEQHHSGDFISKLIYDTERASDIYSSRSAQTAGSDNRSGSLSASHDVLQSTVDIVSVIDKCGIHFLVNHYFAHPMKQAGKELAQNNVGMIEAMNQYSIGGGAGQNLCGR